MAPNNHDPLILTIDVGTQSVRASLFDKQGTCLSMEKESYEPAYYSSKPGYAEIDADEYFDYMSKAIRRLTEKKPNLVERIAGITIDTFRDSAVLLDAENKPLRPIILWLDSRMAKCEKKLPLWSRFLFALVGKTYTVEVNRRRSMMNWVKENEPEIFGKVAKYVNVSTYLIYRLTGKLVDTASSYSGHYPLDYKKGQFYKNPTKHLQGQVFSVRKDQLCPLVEPGVPLGGLQADVAKDFGLPEGLPLLVAGSDKTCETLGVGVIDTSMAAISLGTAATIETTTRKYVESIKFLPSFMNVIPNSYNMDIQIYRGFWMVNWFLREFAAMQIDDLFAESDPAHFNARINDVPPGCDGLVLQPFWGSPLDRPEVKGSMIGFSDGITREHIYRAIIEGIAFELCYDYGVLNHQLKGKFKPKEIRLSGGGAKSDEVCQIFADVFGIPTTRVQTIETSSLGAAIAGFLNLKEFASPEEAIASMVHKKDTFVPNPETHAIYDDIFKNAYLPLYPSLKKVYRYIFASRLK